MRLVHRQTQLEDLPACAELVRDGFLGKDRPLIGELVLLWEYLIEACLANSAVIVDHEANPPAVVGFGLSICVTDEFAEEAKTSAAPYLARQLLDRWQAGRFPALGLRQIRQANKGAGLNVFGLHTLCGGPNVGERNLGLVRDRMGDSLFSTHRGYNIKSFMKEIYGEDERRRHLQFGLLEVNNYGGGLGSEGQTPYLVGMSREDALDPKYEGRFVRELFRYSAPVCAFTAADQELLQLALTGMTETDIAGTLGISTDSVKSRWNSVYSHLPRELSRRLFASLDESQSKSRRLLHWVRSHPEELRPTLSFKGVDLIGDYAEVILAKK